MENRVISLLVIMMISLKIYSQSTSIKYADSLLFLGNYSKAIEVYKSNNLSDVHNKIVDAYAGIGNDELASEDS